MRHWIIIFAVISLLAGCNSSSDNAVALTPGDNTQGGSTASAAARYDIANKCYTLQSVATKKFIVKNGSSYQASANNSSAAMNFYFKPTALGKYMLYAADQTLLALAGKDPSGVATGLGVSGFQLTSIDAPANQSNWQVNHGVIWVVKKDDNGFYFRSREHDPEGEHHMLAVNAGNGALTTADKKLDDNAAQRFTLVPAKQCTPFPEISTDTIGKTFKGNGVDQPVLGFADVHSHIAATGFLGGGHVGRPFSKYGVPQALPKADTSHGPNGILDLIGNFYGGTPLRTIDTHGWPTFKDWPGYDMLTYENTYHRWIKRTYDAGLRLVVNNLVQNDALCALNQVLQVANPSDPDLISKVQRVLAGAQSADTIPDGLLDGLVSKILDGTAGAIIGKHSCNGMQTALRQAHFLYRMQDYIDAQNGGPGKGWFRIVTTPEQAREVINNGKLAVVMGLEIANPFDCYVTLVGIGDIPLVKHPQCDRQQIKTDLDALYKLGVRQINLVHEFNNALGGNGIFNGSIINVGNFFDTGQFWRIKPCPDTKYYYSPAVDMLSIDPGSYTGSSNPLSSILDNLTQGLLPTYPAGDMNCNKRAITDLGRYAVKQVMAHHMMIDIDHMSVQMKGQVIQMAKNQTPMYPVISSHGGHGGITMQQAKDIIKTGGLINPIDVTPKGLISNLKRLKAITPKKDLLAMSYTSDVNGMAAQPGPSKPEITYPFTLFSGPGWGAKFDRISPVTFKQSCIPQGDRCFDYNKEGIAQYGLYADWVEGVYKAAQNDPDLNTRQVMNALYSSAEHYIEVWERASRQRDITGQ